MSRRRVPVLAFVFALAAAGGFALLGADEAAARRGRSRRSVEAVAPAVDAGVDAGVDSGATDAGDAGGDAAADSGAPYDSGVESVDDQIAAAGAFAWPASPSGCGPAPYALTSRDGGPSIPASGDATTWSCDATTNYAAGREPVGNLVGLTKLNTLNDAIGFPGGGGWVTSVASGLPAVADGDNFGLCAVIRPTSTTGTKYIFNRQISASEYIRLYYGNPTPTLRVRESGSGSGNIDQTISGNYMPINEWHLLCAHYQGVCEVQSSGRPCLGVCVDGNCSFGSEIATNLQAFETPSATGTSVAMDSSSANTFVGDIARVWWFPTAAANTMFGTTQAGVQAANRRLCQNLGICSPRKALLLIAGGQSNMQGYPNTPVHTTQTRTNFEGIGTVNDIALLVEGTGNGVYESMGWSLGEGLKGTFGRGEDVFWVERGQSNVAIASWAPGQTLNTTLIGTWVTNAVNFGCGRWDSMRAFAFWDQGESDLPTGSGWAAALAAIQDGWDTTVQALPCVEDLEVVLFLDQTSSFTKYGYTTSALVDTEQVAAMTSYPTQIKVCGPRYQMDYTADGIHLSATGQASKGAQSARCLDTYLRTGDWLPTYITAAQVSGSSVIVSVHTPQTPLIGSCSGTGVTDPGNGGWEWSDDNGRTISSVSYGTCVGDTCPVTLTLSGAPSASNRYVSVARTGTLNANAGPTTGARSCIHDSGTPAAWHIHQRFAVP